MSAPLVENVISPWETATKLVELTDPQGHKHYLKNGTPLPAWVDEDTIQRLAANRQIMKFQVI